MAAWPKVWVCGSSFPRIAGSNPAEAWMSVSCCLCCKVEVSTRGRSLVQRSPTESGVSECDREATILRRPWTTKGCRAIGGGGLAIT